MEMPKKHYSNYLISVHFDRGFMPDSLAGKIEMCENFLNDLGNLARSNGKRLFASYSIVDGQNTPHAHFAVSWLPCIANGSKQAKKSKKSIARYTVTRLLDNNYFIVDNPKQAIKRITHDKEYVTKYVIEQPKDGQSTIYSAFFSYHDFVPVCSETKLQSYCSKQQFRPSQNIPQNIPHNKLSLIFLISVAWFILISAISLSLF